MKRSAGKNYKFGRFSVDGAERLLFDGTDAVAVTPKAFDTLLLLIENAGHVLSKEKIMEEVWEDSFVEENNLAQNISALRRALGETAGTRYIETVPKYGYRFIFPVDAEEPDNVSTEVYEKTRSRIFIDE